MLLSHIEINCKRQRNAVFLQVIKHYSSLENNKPNYISLYRFAKLMSFDYKLIFTTEINYKVKTIKCYETDIIKREEIRKIFVSVILLNDRKRTRKLSSKRIPFNLSYDKILYDIREKKFTDHTFSSSKSKNYCKFTN